jgi:UDPglucose 6-dehydrogenase
LAHRAGELGAVSLENMLKATDDANAAARRRALDLVLSSASGATKVAILGAAFKPGSDDLRDSPAVWLVRALRKEFPNVEFAWHDPALSGRVLEGVELADSVENAVRDADLVVLATDWADYKETDPVTLRPRRRVLVDLRNCVYAPKWVRAGWSVRFLGRPSRSPRQP